MPEPMGDAVMERWKLQRRDLFSIILCILSIGIIGYCLYVYLHIAAYVIPAADDFTISADIRESRLLGESYLHLGLRWMREVYLTWQGTFISNFLLYYIAPYVRMGTDGIRLFCVFGILFFYGSLWMLVHCIMKHLLKCKEVAMILFVYALITWLISNARIVMEVFFWYNGICVYTLPLTFTLIGIRHLIRFTYVKMQQSDFIGAIAFGILACGGVLQCSAIVCFVYLLICLWGFFTKHSGRVKLLSVFMMAFVSALINCLAPGNFTRQGTINESGLPIFKAFGYSLSNVMREFERLLIETDMLYLLMVVLLAGLVLWHKEYQKLRVNVWMIVFTVLGVFLCMWVSCYPVALGYSSMLMEPRGYFVIDVFMIIGFMLCAFMIGGGLQQLMDYHAIKRKILCGASVAFVIVVLAVADIMGVIKEIERPLLVCVEDDKLGYLARFRDEWENILKQIENADGDKVIIQSRPIPSLQELKNPDLSENSDYWINSGVARYFEKETVQIEWLE